jgi:hypothetical protein
MPKLGYGYALYPGSPSSLPSDISGLGLWLKADAGVDTTTQKFVSKIVISGAGTTSSNGTYIRNDPESLVFNSTTNLNYISYDQDNSIWYLQDANVGTTYSTYDLQNWLIYDGELPLPSSKNTIIPNQFISEVTLVGAGSAGIDGTYKRSVGGRTPFYQQNGNSIYYNTDISAWLTSDFTYSNNGDFVTWFTENGDDPAPVGVNLKYSAITYKVNSWADQSGNKLNMLPGREIATNGWLLPPTSAAPYYVSSSSNFSGKPSIQFDGLYNFMQTKATTLGNNEFSFFIVSKNYNTNTNNNDDSNTNQSLFIKGDATDVHYPGTSFSLFEYGAGIYTPNFGFTDSYDDSHWSISFTNSTNTRLYTCAIQSGVGSSLWINGSLIGQQTTGTNVVNNTIPLAIGNSSYGYDFNGPSKYNALLGEVAEVIMYNRFLSATERKQVEGYLNAKYAIY